MKNTRDLWIALTKVYGKMGDVDSVKGLWLELVQENSLDLGAKIKSALDLKSNGEIKEAASQFYEVLDSCQADLVQEIQREYLESLAYLGKWTEVKNNLNEPNSLKIKSYMRLNEFAELTEVVKNIKPALLYTRYPYEMSLLNITQDDPDRAKYYLDQEFSRFVEKWQSLNPLSFSARHKLVQKLQKIYELSEFLSIYHLRNGEGADDFSEKVGNMFENWKMRSPSISLDDLSVWEELLFPEFYFMTKSGQAVHM